MIVKSIIPSLALLMSAPAMAQVSFGGDEPIDVIAERAAYKGPKTTLSGDVDVRQGTSRILADEMDLFRQKVKDDSERGFSYGNVNLIVAKGDFKYITPENNVKGNKGVYERNKNIITVTGNVTFTQNNGNSASGEELEYDLTTNRAKFESKCSGQDCDQADRVNITIGE